MSLLTKWRLCGHEELRAGLVCCNACEKSWSCRECHDEANVGDHQLDRSHISALRCPLCDEKNTIEYLAQFKDTSSDEAACVGCHRRWNAEGFYVCVKCNLIAHRSIRHVRVYHCDKCDVCLQRPMYARHCDICNVCWPVTHVKGCEACEIDGLQPYEEACIHCHVHFSGRDLCAICLQELQSATIVRLNCMHRFHRLCLNRYLTDARKHAPLSCPMCRRALHAKCEEANKMAVLLGFTLVVAGVVVKQL